MAFLTIGVIESIYFRKDLDETGATLQSALVNYL